jgi:hypothetical protein
VSAQPDIAALVAAFPGVSPLPGLPDAWTWSFGGRFHAALALADDPAFAFQVQARDHPETELVRDVLAFARAHGEALRAAAPLAFAEGFARPGAGFDCVAAVLPAVHRYHWKRQPELNEVTFGVFPAYRHEFSGRETQPEAVTRFRMLDLVDLRRGPRPFLRMRYDNTRTRGGSVGPDRGLTVVEVLQRELANLNDAPGSVVEFENHRGQVCTVRWEDGLVAELGERRWRPGASELADWAEVFLRHGADG